MGDNFKSFVCVQEVNSTDFFIPGVYNVDAETYDGKIVKQQIVCFNSDYEKPTNMDPTLTKSGIVIKSIKTMSKIKKKIKKILEKKIKNVVIPKKKFKQYMEETQYQNMIESIANNVMKFKREIRNEMKMIEKQY